MTANDQPAPAGDSATPATSAGTGRRKRESGVTTTPSSATTPDTQTSTLNGADAGSTGLVPTTGSQPISSSSESPSSGSKKRWQAPKSLNEFASQANAVATLVLNEEINIDKARVYASVARIVAQAMSVEVSRARFARTVPLLDFPVEAPFEEIDGQEES